MAQPTDKTPISERRRQLKIQHWKLEKAIDAKKTEIDRFKDVFYNTVDFKAAGATSDEKRKHHFKILCYQNPEIVRMQSELAELEDQAKAIDFQISDINFQQRERQIDAALELAGQLERFATLLDKLDASMFTFVEGAQRVENAVNRLTGNANPRSSEKVA